MDDIDELEGASSVAATYNQPYPQGAQKPPFHGKSRVIGPIYDRMHLPQIYYGPNATHREPVGGITLGDTLPTELGRRAKYLLQLMLMVASSERSGTPTILQGVNDYRTASSIVEWAKAHYGPGRYVGSEAAHEAGNSDLVSAQQQRSHFMPRNLKGILTWGLSFSMGNALRLGSAMRGIDPRGQATGLTGIHPTYLMTPASAMRWIYSSRSGFKNDQQMSAKRYVQGIQKYIADLITNAAVDRVACANNPQVSASIDSASRVLAERPTAEEENMALLGIEGYSRRIDENQRLADGRRRGRRGGRGEEEGAADDDDDEPPLPGNNLANALDEANMMVVDQAAEIALSKSINKKVLVLTPIWGIIDDGNGKKEKKVVASILSLLLLDPLGSLASEIDAVANAVRDRTSITDILKDGGNAKGFTEMYPEVMAASKNDPSHPVFDFSIGKFYKYCHSFVTLDVALAMTQSDAISRCLSLGHPANPFSDMLSFENAAQVIMASFTPTRQELAEAGITVGPPAPPGGPIDDNVPDGDFDFHAAHGNTPLRPGIEVEISGRMHTVRITDTSWKRNLNVVDYFPYGEPSLRNGEHCCAVVPAWSYQIPTFYAFWTRKAYCGLADFVLPWIEPMVMGVDPKGELAMYRVRELIAREKSVEAGYTNMDNMVKMIKGKALSSGFELSRRGGVADGQQQQPGAGHLRITGVEGLLSMIGVTPTAEPAAAGGGALSQANAHSQLMALAQKTKSFLEDPLGPVVKDPAKRRAEQDGTSPLQKMGEAATDVWDVLMGMRVHPPMKNIRVTRRMLWEYVRLVVKPRRSTLTLSNLRQSTSMHGFPEDGVGSLSDYDIGGRLDPENPLTKHVTPRVIEQVLARQERIQNAGAPFNGSLGGFTMSASSSLGAVAGGGGGGRGGGNGGGSMSMDLSDDDDGSGDDDRGGDKGEDHAGGRGDDGNHVVAVIRSRYTWEELCRDTDGQRSVTSMLGRGRPLAEEELFQGNHIQAVLASMDAEDRLSMSTSDVIPLAKKHLIATHLYSMGFSPGPSARGAPFFEMTLGDLAHYWFQCDEWISVSGLGSRPSPEYQRQFNRYYNAQLSMFKCQWSLMNKSMPPSILYQMKWFHNERNKGSGVYAPPLGRLDPNVKSGLSNYLIELQTNLWSIYGATGEPGHHFILFATLFSTTKVEAIGSMRMHPLMVGPFGVGKSRLMTIIASQIAIPGTVLRVGSLSRTALFGGKTKEYGRLWVNDEGVGAQGGDGANPDGMGTAVRKRLMAGQPIDHWTKEETLIATAAGVGKGWKQVRQRFELQSNCMDTSNHLAGGKNADADAEDDRRIICMWTHDPLVSAFVAARMTGTSTPATKLSKKNFIYIQRWTQYAMTLAFALQTSKACFRINMMVFDQLTTRMNAALMKTHMFSMRSLRKISLLKLVAEVAATLNAIVTAFRMPGGACYLQEPTPDTVAKALRLYGYCDTATVISAWAAWYDQIAGHSDGIVMRGLINLISKHDNRFSETIQKAPTALHTVLMLGMGMDSIQSNTERDFYKKHRVRTLVENAYGNVDVAAARAKLLEEKNESQRYWKRVRINAQRKARKKAQQRERRRRQAARARSKKRSRDQGENVQGDDFEDDDSNGDTSGRNDDSSSSDAPLANGRVPNANWEGDFITDDTGSGDGGQGGGGDNGNGSSFKTTSSVKMVYNVNYFKFRGNIPQLAARCVAMTGPSITAEMFIKQLRSFKSQMATVPRLVFRRADMELLTENWGKWKKETLGTAKASVEDVDEYLRFAIPQFVNLPTGDTNIGTYATMSRDRKNALFVDSLPIIREDKDNVYILMCALTDKKKDIYMSVLRECVVKGSETWDKIVLGTSHRCGTFYGTFNFHENLARDLGNDRKPVYSKNALRVGPDLAKASRAAPYDIRRFAEMIKEGDALKATTMFMKGSRQFIREQAGGNERSARTEIRNPAGDPVSFDWMAAFEVAHAYAFSGTDKPMCPQTIWNAYDKAVSSDDGFKREVVSASYDYPNDLLPTHFEMMAELGVTPSSDVLEQAISHFADGVLGDDLPLDGTGDDDDPVLNRQSSLLKASNILSCIDQTNQAELATALGVEVIPQGRSNSAQDQGRSNDNDDRANGNQGTGDSEDYDDEALAQSLLLRAGSKRGTTSSSPPPPQGRSNPEVGSPPGGPEINGDLDLGGAPSRKRPRGSLASLLFSARQAHGEDAADEGGASQ